MFLEFWDFYFFCFFFFQAEDGIRDRDVTGVQTCALPICQVDALERGEVPGRGLERLEDVSEPDQVALVCHTGGWGSYRMYNGGIVLSLGVVRLAVHTHTLDRSRRSLMKADWRNSAA